MVEDSTIDGYLVESPSCRISNKRRWRVVMWWPKMLYRCFKEYTKERSFFSRKREMVTLIELGDEWLRMEEGGLVAVSFRSMYLKHLDNKEIWQHPEQIRPVLFDFTFVERIGPRFASIVFGHFRRYASAADILRVIRFQNITRVQQLIIEQEIKDCPGYDKMGGLSG